MKPKLLIILEMAVDQGITVGWNRAHKHVEKPDETLMKAAMNDAIMGKFYEYFTFDREEYQEY